MVSARTPAALLHRALPSLERVWQDVSNGKGVFPIFNPKQLEQAWKAFPPRIPDEEGAAVLVPVCQFQGKPSILFTKRASHLSQHAAEISFAGGHSESSDSNLIETALRETSEEVDIPIDDAIVLGMCTAVPSIKGTPVTPVVAVLPNELEEIDLRGDPSEVEVVFCCSIASLLAEETTRHLGRLGRPAPVFPTPHGDIWGLTAFVLSPILRKLLCPVFKEMENDSNVENVP